MKIGLINVCKLIKLKKKNKNAIPMIYDNKLMETIEADPCANL